MVLESINRAPRETVLCEHVEDQHINKAPVYNYRELQFLLKKI